MSIKAKGYPAWYINQPLVLSSHFQGIALATFGGSLYIPSLNPKEGLKELLSGNGYRVPERPARLSNGPPVRPGREYVIRRFTLKRLLEYVIIT